MTTYFNSKLPSSTSWLKKVPKMTTRWRFLLYLKFDISKSKGVIVVKSIKIAKFLIQTSQYFMFLFPVSSSTNKFSSNKTHDIQITALTQLQQNTELISTFSIKVTNSTDFLLSKISLVQLFFLYFAIRKWDKIKFPKTTKLCTRKFYFIYSYSQLNVL